MSVWIVCRNAYIQYTIFRGIQMNAVWYCAILMAALDFNEILVVERWPNCLHELLLDPIKGAWQGRSGKASWHCNEHLVRALGSLGPYIINLIPHSTETKITTADFMDRSMPFSAILLYNSRMGPIFPSSSVSLTFAWSSMTYRDDTSAAVCTVHSNFVRCTVNCHNLNQGPMSSALQTMLMELWLGLSSLIRTMTADGMLPMQGDITACSES